MFTRHGRHMQKTTQKYSNSWCEKFATYFIGVYFVVRSKQVMLHCGISSDLWPGAKVTNVSLTADCIRKQTLSYIFGMLLNYRVGYLVRIRFHKVSLYHDMASLLYEVQILGYAECWIYITRDTYNVSRPNYVIMSMQITALQWRHNERDCVSNNRRLDCLFNRLFRPRKHQSSASLAFVCEGKPPVTGGFPSQRVKSIMRTCSICWRHHGITECYWLLSAADSTGTEVSHESMYTHYREQYHATYIILHPIKGAIVRGWQPVVSLLLTGFVFSQRYCFMLRTGDVFSHQQLGSHGHLFYIGRYHACHQYGYYSDIIFND